MQNQIEMKAVHGSTNSNFILILLLEFCGITLSEQLSKVHPGFTPVKTHFQ